MAFSRKFLKALGIEDDKVETIMEEHTAVTEALKKDRDTYKADADKLTDVQKELNDLKQKQPDEDYKKKYEDLVAENQARDTRAAKSSAYRKAAETAGVGSQYLDLLVKANREEIDKLELDESGAIKDADKYVEGLKSSLKDYIPEKGAKGVTVDQPPKNTGGKRTREEIMAIKDATERQQAIAENIDVFQ